MEIPSVTNIRDQCEEVCQTSGTRDRLACIRHTAHHLPDLVITDHSLFLPQVAEMMRIKRAGPSVL